MVGRPPQIMYDKHFQKKLDIDNDGKIWTLWEAFTSLKEARKDANKLRKGHTGEPMNARLIGKMTYHLVYYRRK